MPCPRPSTVRPFSKQHHLTHDSDTLTDCLALHLETLHMLEEVAHIQACPYAKVHNSDMSLRQCPRGASLSCDHGLPTHGAKVVA